ncbi:hypothetical protein EVAR_604_1 [Eumeta japonica]|uniref:Uncharacterized protein n=1 Tax=Eumeta variegata TaxID=151549 RepID=A0A4C2A9B0_EUMVA|nr:hypothetical protein EVAR_604_1 [Eumeta japonica]
MALAVRIELVIQKQQKRDWNRENIRLTRVPIVYLLPGPRPTTALSPPSDILPDAGDASVTALELECTWPATITCPTHLA